MITPDIDLASPIDRQERLSYYGLILYNPAMTFSWTDIDEIAYQLTEAHPDADPTVVTFPKLKAMVEALEGFVPGAGQSVNEQILEAIQQAWIDEAEDAAADRKRQAEDEDDDTDELGYSPNQPFR